jgi:hypothetical protein
MATLTWRRARGPEQEGVQGLHNGHPESLPQHGVGHRLSLRMPPPPPPQRTVRDRTDDIRRSSSRSAGPSGTVLNVRWDTDRAFEEAGGDTVAPPTGGSGTVSSADALALVLRRGPTPLAVAASIMGDIRARGKDPGAPGNLPCTRPHRHERRPTATAMQGHGKQRNSTLPPPSGCHARRDHTPLMACRRCFLLRPRSLAAPSRPGRIRSEPAGPPLLARVGHTY